MTEFKTLDTRGLSFFNAFDLTTKAFKDVSADGILEIVLDKKKNFIDAFRKLVETKGYTVSDVDDDGRWVRLFIQKVTRLKHKS